MSISDLFQIIMTSFTVKLRKIKDGLINSIRTSRALFFHGNFVVDAI